jgi:hypothetical protein
MAGPLLIGGFAAGSSAAAGEAWILAVGAVAAIVTGVVLKKRGTPQSAGLKLTHSVTCSSKHTYE